MMTADQLGHRLAQGFERDDRPPGEQTAESHDADQSVVAGRPGERGAGQRKQLDVRSLRFGLDEAPVEDEQPAGGQG